MGATYRQGYLGGRDGPASGVPAESAESAVSLQEIGAFMDALEARGVTFAFDGDRLAIAAPPGVLTVEDEAELVRCKDPIARLVRSAVTPWGQAQPATASGVAVQLTMTEAA